MDDGSFVLIRESKVVVKELPGDIPIELGRRDSLAFFELVSPSEVRPFRFLFQLSHVVLVKQD